MGLRSGRLRTVASRRNACWLIACCLQRQQTHAELPSCQQTHVLDDAPFHPSTKTARHGSKADPSVPATATDQLTIEPANGISCDSALIGVLRVGAACLCEMTATSPRQARLTQRLASAQFESLCANRNRSRNHFVSRCVQGHVRTGMRNGFPQGLVATRRRFFANRFKLCSVRTCSLCQ